jgi:hypothetical protein
LSGASSQKFAGLDYTHIEGDEVNVRQRDENMCLQIRTLFFGHFAGQFQRILQYGGRFPVSVAPPGIFRNEMKIPDCFRPLPALLEVIRKLGGHFLQTPGKQFLQALTDPLVQA